MRNRRRMVLGALLATPVVAALALAVLLLPGRAHADANPPTRVTVDLTGSFTLPSSFTGCSFVIMLTQTGTGVVTTYYDSAGNPTDIFTRSPQLTVSYYSQSGTPYSSTSPASTHVDVVHNTITYDGLQAHIVIPGQGLIGAATGHVIFNTVTGALLVAHGQTTLLTPFSPEVCSLLSH